MDGRQGYTARAPQLRYAMRRWTRSLGYGMAIAGLCSLLSACSSSTSVASTEELQTAEGPQFYTQFEDYLVVMADCLKEEGFAAVISKEDYNASSSLNFPAVPEEQQDELRKAIERCGDQIQQPRLPIDDETFQDETYDWLVGQRDCLEAAGFAMPPAPSYAVFVEQLKAGGGVPWSPIAEAANDAAAQGRALKACPMTTESW